MSMVLDNLSFLGGILTMLIICTALWSFAYGWMGFCGMSSLTLLLMIYAVNRLNWK